MAVRTGDLFGGEAAAPETYADKQQSTSAKRYQNAAQLLSRGLAAQTRRHREAYDEEQARIADIEERAAEYSDFDEHADTATHNTIASRGMQGASFGPWGALAGTVFGAGEALVKGAKSGNLKTVANEILNPFESIPGSIDAIGGQFSGRNASGIDSPELAAANVERTGRAVQSGYDAWGQGGDGPEDFGEIPALTLEDQFMPDQTTIDTEMFDTNLGAGDNLTVPTQNPDGLFDEDLLDSGIEGVSTYDEWLRRQNRGGG